MSDWWDDVAAELQARSEHAPDPWADFVEGATDEHLTDEQRAYLEQVKRAGGLAGVATCYEDEQRAFLRQLDDQPALGRLTDD